VPPASPLATHGRSFTAFVKTTAVEERRRKSQERSRDQDARSKTRDKTRDKRFN
jgi:hypothetical protein